MQRRPFATATAEANTNDGARALDDANEPVRESRVGVVRGRSELDAGADPFVDELSAAAKDAASNRTNADASDAEPWRGADVPLDFGDYVAGRWGLPRAEAFALLCGWLDSYVPRREYEIRLLSSQSARTNKTADH